ncbi:hypothetical protein AO392_14130 [Pseudomonas putida]|nr:hypothetical protein [Pseudomonas putida]KTC25361.1 hypothetical protein AO392_14130 [Pseudomonas putida]
MQLLLRGNADAGVGDLKFQRDVLPFAPDHATAQHNPPDVGELDRVAQQVVEDLPDAHLVPYQLVGYFRCHAGIDLQALGTRVGDVRGHHVLDQAQWRKGHRLKGELTRLDPGHVQHIADQLQQCGGRALDDAEVIHLALVEAGQAEQLQGAQYAVQRGADLVAHGRQEEGLGFTGLVGHGLGLAQGHRAFQVFGDVGERAQQNLLVLVAGRGETEPETATLQHHARLAAQFDAGLARHLDDGLRHFATVLGTLIFHHHLVVVQADDNQPGRCTFDHRQAERLAVEQLAPGLASRRDDLPAIVVVQPPQQGAEQRKCQHDAQQR